MLREIAATVKAVKRYRKMARALFEDTADIQRALGRAETWALVGLKELAAIYGDTHAHVTGAPVAVAVPVLDIAAETAAMAELHAVALAEFKTAEAQATEAEDLRARAERRLAAEAAIARTRLSNLETPALEDRQARPLDRLPAPVAA